MKYIYVLLAGVFFLSGCVGMERRVVGVDGLPEPTVIFNQTDSGFILSCLYELGSVRSEEFDEWFAESEEQLVNFSDEDKLRFICLSLHLEANYEQFQKGLILLEAYTLEETRDRQAMSGLLDLVNRLDEGKVSRWSMRKKLLNEKEGLKKEMETLKGDLKHGEVKIKELQNQIEQLKNIENIMKSREHSL